MNREKDEGEKMKKLEFEENSAVKKLSSDLDVLKNELQKRDDVLKTVENKFESYREKNVQFYEILKLCEAQINKPNIAAEETNVSLDLMNDIRKELKRLSRSSSDQRKTHRSHKSKTKSDQSE